LLFSSSGVITSSKSFPKSRYSDFSQTNISLPVASRSRESHKHCCDSGISSPLPSDRFKYVTWKDIKDHDVKGIQIHCARIREGPTEQELFLKRDKDVLLVKRKSRERELREERLQEDWENCKKNLLSFPLVDQDQRYDLESFSLNLELGPNKTMTLNLPSNHLDPSEPTFPLCRELNLNRNHLTSFKQLPKLPQILHLSLAENNIQTLSGLADLRKSPLESLTLKRNPCEFQEHYRSR
uniref:Uncharacterized protein n=1 Tax=Latimeria chalumnae TaxID=7897 RepID=H3AYT1_LATCH